MTDRHETVASNSDQALRQQLAGFMIGSAEHYRQLERWQYAMDGFFAPADEEEQPLPYVGYGNFSQFMQQLIETDINVINNHIVRLGGAIEVEYIDPFDQEHMRGIFSGCRGYTNQHCWLMDFSDDRRQHIGAPVLPQQLPQAMKLV